MASNFDFLKAHHPGIAQTARKAEQYALSDPRASAMYSRLVLEELVAWVFANDDAFAQPVTDYKPSLNDRMSVAAFRDALPPNLFREMESLRRGANKSVHNISHLSDMNDSVAFLKTLYGFGVYVLGVYHDEAVLPRFDETLFPPSSSGALPAAEKKRLEEAVRQNSIQLEAKTQQLTENARQLHRTQAELESLQIQLALRKQHQRREWKSLLTEAETRERYIDTLFMEAGWDLGDGRSTEVPVTGLPTPSGNGFADYVLWGDDGKPLAVIEAKRTRASEQQGQDQAKRYADALERQYGQRPVIFYTNGFATWLWDDCSYPPRRVYGFYKKDELERLVLRRIQRKELSLQPVNKSIADRYYQERAIRRCSEEFTRSRRKTLLVMATGSGKTRTAAALVDLLSKAHWAKRILFLADRTPLVVQAKNNFGKYLPNHASVNLSREDENSDSRLVFATYQSMINRIDGRWDNDSRYYGVGHFDLIIIDEAHRSIYNRYQAIFDYFDALLLGLTATPKSETDRDTYEFFDRQPGDPTDAYELETAVADGFLTDYRVVKVGLRFALEGIKYHQLSEEEKAEYEKKFRDADGNLPPEIDSSALNKWLFNQDTADKVLTYLMTSGIHVEGGDKLGKSIIFAKNHEHAKFILERFNALYPHLKGHFCKIIDNYQSQPQALIDEFSEKGKNDFQIAISVDMLDTGIDIEQIVNLVFFKRVRSRAKFWQMIGRGTRLCPDLFGPGQDKAFFYIFDFCANFDFFDHVPKGVEPTTQRSLGERIFAMRLQLWRAIPANAEPTLATYKQSLNTGLHADVCALDDESFVVRQKLAWVEKYKDPYAWQALEGHEAVEIIQHIAPLMQDPGSVESTRWFDLLLYQLQHAWLTQSDELPTYLERTKKLIRSLSKQGGIREVGEKMPLLRTLQTDAFWQAATLTGIEGIRHKLRDLMQFLDSESRKPVYTNFADEVMTVSEVSEPRKAYADLSIYRERAERMIREKMNHLVIRKLISNTPITKPELEELDRMLFEATTLDNREMFEQAVGQKPLGVFVRSIVGLDQNAAKEAFSQFQANGPLTSDQTEFINMLINYLVKNGTVDRNMLFSSPFTDVNDRGISGVFDPANTDKIISIIERITTNAQEVA